MIRFDSPPPPLHRRARWRLGRHRRTVAAVMAGTGVWLGASGVVAVVAPRTAEVVVATADLPAGTVLGPADLQRRRWPVDLLPAGTVTAEEVLGSHLVTPVQAGVPLTDRSAAGGRTGPVVGDRVQVVAGLADPWSASLVVPGDEVDVHLPADGWGVDPAGPPGRDGPSTVLAEGAVVVRLLGDAPAGAAGGLLGDSGPPASGVALVLAVTAAEGRRLAAVAGRGVALTVPPPAAGDGSDRGG